MSIRPDVCMNEPLCTQQTRVLAWGSLDNVRLCALGVHQQPLHFPRLAALADHKLMPFESVPFHGLPLVGGELKYDLPAAYPLHIHRAVFILEGGQKRLSALVHLLFLILLAFLCPLYRPALVVPDPQIGA